MIFINTRPENRANDLSKFLRERQVQVIDLPLLSLESCSLSKQEQIFLGNLLNIGCNSIILVSEDAVKYGLDKLYQQFCLVKNSSQALQCLMKIQWIAVGQKTAECFNELWQRYWQVLPPVVTYPLGAEQQNNQGMLTLPAIQSLTNNDKIQVWRGHGGRELLINHLRKRGVDVELLNLYQRVLPENSTIKFQQLLEKLNLTEEHNNNWVLISSLTTWQYWQQLLEKFATCPQKFRYLVLQPRIAEQITRQINVSVRIVMELKPPVIYQTLCKT